MIIAALVVPAVARSQSWPRWTFAEVHMGMPVRLTFHGPDERAARKAAAATFERIAALDRELSDYRPDSELNAINARAGEWVRVSPDLVSVLDVAQRMARLTAGAFDPTVGPLVSLWRDARRESTMPPPEATASARALVAWRHLEIDRRGRRVRLATPGMRLDLGGIAKGYVLDEALATLADAGITRVLVEAGGDIVAGDPPPGEQGWKVNVPGADDEFAARAAVLARQALATSGGTSQFVEVDGVRYSHVVNPSTGLGLTRAAVVHVLAPDGATADALATAIGVVGLDCAGSILREFPDVRVAEIGERARCR